MKSILLIGLNHFGTLLARQLYELGHEIMAVDRNEERVNDILPFVTDAQIGDSTNEAFLRSLGINNYDVCIVTIGEDFQSSLETTSLLKDLGGKLVVSRADREPQARFLLKNGADVNEIWKDDADITPIFRCFQIPDIEVLKTLVKRGADINYCSKWRGTSLAFHVKRMLGIGLFHNDRDVLGKKDYEILEFLL